MMKAFNAKIALAVRPVQEEDHAGTMTPIFLIAYPPNYSLPNKWYKFEIMVADDDLNATYEERGK